MKFVEMLMARWKAADTLLCVGLDPDPARFPEHLRRRDDSIFEFCKSIVDATADFALCVQAANRVLRIGGRRRGAATADRLRSHESS